MSLTEWPDVLRTSPHFPYPVRVLNNFATNRPQGNLRSLDGVFWHHDASQPGPSPGDVDWLITEYNAGRPSAQILVSYDGTWNFVGSGYASHAGTVRGKFGNPNTVGIETDHTINEQMSPRLKDSMERGLAVIANHEGRSADFVMFHKIEAIPRGRKVDPYFSGEPNDQTHWDDELVAERGIIQNHILTIQSGKVPQPEEGIVTQAQFDQFMNNYLSNDNNAKFMAQRVLLTQSMRGGAESFDQQQAQMYRWLQGLAEKEGVS